MYSEQIGKLYWSCMLHGVTPPNTLVWYVSWTHINTLHAIKKYVSLSMPIFLIILMLFIYVSCDKKISSKLTDFMVSVAKTETVKRMCYHILKSITLGLQLIWKSCLLLSSGNISTTSEITLHSETHNISLEERL